MTMPEEPIKIEDLPDEQAIKILMQEMGFRSRAAAMEYLAIARGIVDGDILEESQTE